MQVLVFMSKFSLPDMSCKKQRWMLASHQKDFQSAENHFMMQMICETVWMGRSTTSKIRTIRGRGEVGEL